MTDAEKIMCLEQENSKLREDNEMLLNIIARMKVTLNRLVSRYVFDQNLDKMA